MSINHHHPVLPGESLEESREIVLASAPTFPASEHLLVEDLSEDEEVDFLAAIADA